LTTDKTDRVSAGAWFTLAILVLMMILSTVDRGLIALLVKPIRQSLGVSDVQISLLYGLAFGLFYALFSAPLGWLADKWSRRWVIFLCITIWSLATAACGLANSFWALAAARFAVGFGEGGLSPAAYRMLGDAFPRRRIGLAVGLFGAGASLSSPVSQLLGGRLVDWAAQIGGMTLPIIGHLQPWQLVFVVMGLPGVLLAPVMFLTPKEKAADKAPAPVETIVATAAPATDAQATVALQSLTLMAFLRTRWLYLALVFLGFGFVGMFSYGVAAWMPTFFQRHFGLSMTTIGANLAVVAGLAGAVSFVVGGAVSDRLFARGMRDGHFRYFLICLPVLVAAGVIAFVVMGQASLAFAAVACFYLVTPTTAPAVAHLQLATPPHLRGQVMALFNMTFNIIGLTTGPLFVALLTEHVFKDPGKIGLSIATVLALSGTAAFLLFLASLKPARAAIALVDGAAPAKAA
jgi:MFS family permease